MEMKTNARLCCPACKGGLHGDKGFVTCNACGLSYPLVKGRPLLVPSIAQKGFESESPLLSAARMLPDRNQIPPLEGRQNLGTKEFFFTKLFRQFDPRDPHWNFLGNKVNEMVEKIPPGATVLDIGAGECKYAALLPHTQYVSADLVFSSDKHDFSRIDIVADASAIPFQDDSFDVALNLVVLEHVPDPALTVREMARVLLPGGLAFALIPLVRPEHLAPFDFHRFTRYGIRNLFESNGFRIDSIEGSNGALWSAVHYARLIVQTQPLTRFGRRSLRGIFWNRFWFVVLWPLVAYARTSNGRYGDEFPIYFWVRATKIR
jgi:SAM-dependent methyltransferase/uncharacterized protein YbaR (Trm112 family)